MSRRGDEELRKVIQEILEAPDLIGTHSNVIADRIIESIRAEVNKHGPGITYGWFFGNA